MSAYDDALRDQNNLDELRRAEAARLTTQISTSGRPVEGTWSTWVETIEKYLRGDGGNKA